MVATGDVSCLAMSRLFDRLEGVPTPIADAYKVELVGPKDRWRRTELEHMAGWFLWNTTKGEGQYSRQVPNHSARRCYNRLLSHGGLLWIAEAVGVDPATVQEAADAARAVDDYRSKCKAIRQVVTWDVVYEHALPLIEKYKIR